MNEWWEWATRYGLFAFLLGVLALLVVGAAVVNLLGPANARAEARKLNARARLVEAENRRDELAAELQPPRPIEITPEMFRKSDD